MDQLHERAPIDAPAGGDALPGLAAALARLAAGSDAVAWGTVLERIGNDLIRLARHLAHDADLAEDAVQETLLRVRDHAASFRPDHGGGGEAAARRWVLSIAAHETLKLLRRRRIVRRHRERLRVASAPAPAAPPIERVAAAEEAALLREALAELPEAAARAIVMHHLLGMGFDEVALALRMPVGTAKTRVRRGLIALRRRLARRGVALSLLALLGAFRRLPAGEWDASPARFMPLLTSAAKASAPGIAGASLAWAAAALVAASLALAAVPLRHAVAAPVAIGRQLRVAPDGDDAADGVAAPWATLQRAADAARPGDTVHVAPGLYRIARTIDSRASGAAAAPIVFMSDERWAARLVMDGCEILWRERGDHVAIVGFDLSMIGDVGRVGVDVLGSHVRVAGNRVHDIRADDAEAASNSGSGILVDYDAHDVDIEANLVFAIGPPPEDRVNEHVYGISVASGDVRVRGNSVHNCAAWGISGYHALTRAVVANNLIAHCGAGILIGSGERNGGAQFGDDCLVEANVIAGNLRVGIENRGFAGAHNRYRRNCLFANGAGDARLAPRNALEGTLARDPRIVRDGVDGAWRLAADSPCVDAAIGPPIR